MVSYIAKRRRVNIEKKGDEYFIDVRRKRLFPGKYYYSSAEPAHARQYRSEKSVSYKPLRLEELKDGTSPILLFYPEPRELTYSDSKLQIIYGGDKIGGYTVMFWDNLRSLI